jgi:hypothetical protein
MAAFEQTYSAEHVPMAAAIFQAAGRTKAVLTTKILEAAAGTPAFYRIAEIHFPSTEALQSCAASYSGRGAIPHAQDFEWRSPIVLIAEEEVVTFQGA